MIFWRFFQAFDQRFFQRENVRGWVEIEKSVSIKLFNFPIIYKKSLKVSDANPGPLSKPGYNTIFLGVFQDAKFVFRRYNRHGEVFRSRVGPWGFVHAHSQGRGKSLRTTRFSTHLLRRILITFFILF